MKSLLTRRSFLGLAALGSTSIVASGAGAALLSGCSVPLNPSFILPDYGEKAAGNSGGYLQYAIRQPSAFDPYYVTDVAGIQVTSLLFDPLVRYDYSLGEIVPAAADSWTVSESGLVYTFHLAADGKFHNGRRVTAQDFINSWVRLCTTHVGATEPSPNSAYLSGIKGVAEYIAGPGRAEAEEAAETAGANAAEETASASDASANDAEEAAIPSDASANDASDQNTASEPTPQIIGLRALSERALEISLVKADYDFLNKLTYPGLAPVPLEALQDADENYFYKPVGNGPFMLMEPWTIDSDRLQLYRFDGYHAEPALLKYLDLRFFASAEQGFTELSYAAFENEQVDVARVPPHLFAAAQDAYGQSLDGYSLEPYRQFSGGERACTYYLQFNLQVRPLNDARVRRAISLALDRSAICNETLLGSCSPATDIVPSAIKGSKPNSWAEQNSDTTLAKALLDEYIADALSESSTEDRAGWNILTLINRGNGLPEQLFAAIKKSLDDIGFSVSVVVPTDEATYLSASAGAALEITAWNADFPSMNNFLEPLFTTGGILNTFGYFNAEFEDTLSLALADEYESTRALIYQSANKLVAADMPVVPLFYPRLDVVCSRKVNDLNIGADDMADLRKAWVSLL